MFHLDGVNIKKQVKVVFHISPEHDFSLLSKTIHFLGDTLGKVITNLEGETTLSIEENIRKLAKESRKGKAEATQRLSEIVQGLDTEMAYRMAMAFTCYFELVNMAEENYRVRILTKRRLDQLNHPKKAIPKESIESAFFELKKAKVSKEEIQQILDKMEIVLVFTAHPTEIKRKTILNKLCEISSYLKRESLNSKPSQAVHSTIERLIASLWLTERSRSKNPQVLDEVRTGLWYFEHTLWDVIPELHNELKRVLGIYYPGVTLKSKWISFGSWIGGDRDGNCQVTTSTTAATFILHRNLALSKISQSLERLSEIFSVSSLRIAPTKRIIRILAEKLKSFPSLREEYERYPNEPYRLVLLALKKEVEKAISTISENDLLDFFNEPKPDNTLKAITEVLDALKENFNAANTGILLEGEFQNLTQRLEVFGLHIFSLDIRQHSSIHQEALEEILQLIGYTEPSYALLKEKEKVELLNNLLKGPFPSLSSLYPRASDKLKEVLGPILVFSRSMAILGNEACGCYLISMTSGLSDILEVLYLCKICHCTIDIAPLFETLSDLKSSPQTVNNLLSHPFYRKYLQDRANRQIIMLGYSDSNKDCGYMTSNWWLYHIQEKLHEVCQSHGINLILFHGRGGTIARGGGPAAKAILAQPKGLLDGKIMITEQGEVLSTRYHDFDIAFRILEQTTYGVLLAVHKSRKKSILPKSWQKVIEYIAEESYATYIHLLQNEANFLRFWQEVTPINEIGSLKIASRPIFRFQSNNFEDLRAIPWVFSWMQTRFVIPGWYGIGSSLQKTIERNPKALSVLQRMYEKWPFFQTVIDNAQLSLAKTDLDIARLYCTLASDKALTERIFSIIEAEYKKTVDTILKITQQDKILDNEPILQRSIQLRNPYVDPLNYIQVEMIRRNRASQATTPSEIEKIRSVIELTINGISAGLRNTG
ncbi:phosphoenolpyruvate carboxylase [Methylacidiphilum caldifontis]|nr:phosphoenolpyruvate carboxylase [Methylacidiphilum caldifontis]